MKMGRTLFHSLLIALGLRTPAHQVTPFEQKRLLHYAGSAKLAVEIGVFEGASTRLIAEALPEDGVLYAVDPFLKGRVGIGWSEIAARLHVLRSRSRQKVKFIRTKSHEAAKRFDQTPDFVFIDADHSYAAFARDWRDWSAKLGDGGIIALHDTNVPEDSPSVRRFGSHRYFEESIQYDQRFSLLEQVDSLSILRKS